MSTARCSVKRAMGWQGAASASLLFILLLGVKDLITVCNKGNINV